MYVVERREGEVGEGVWMRLPNGGEQASHTRLAGRPSRRPTTST